MLRLPLILGAVATILCGCTPLQFVNSNLSSELRVEKDLPYGPHERQTLDVYRTPATEQSHDVVIFVHGGYWDSGEKSEYAFVADSLSARGFITVIPNHRLVPNVRFPTYVEDVADAVEWVFDNLRTENVFLMGYSSGAHIAALVSFDERYLASSGISNSQLAGFIGLAGPYDFLPIDPDDDRAAAALGPAYRRERTQPINFVDGNEPHSFLATGLADETVDPTNSLRLAVRIREAGGHATLRTYPNIGHATLVGALARAGRVLEPRVLEDVIGFMRRQVTNRSHQTGS